MNLIFPNFVVISDNKLFHIVPIIYWLWYLKHTICHFRAKNPKNAMMVIKRRYFFLLSFNMLPLLTELRKLDADFIQLGGILNRLITAFLNRNCIFRCFVLFSILSIIESHYTLRKSWYYFHYLFPNFIDIMWNTIVLFLMIHRLTWNVICRQDKVPNKMSHFDWAWYFAYQQWW